MVYVVDVGQMSFAFEAGTAAHAAEIAVAAWFVRAVDRFHADVPGARDPHPRPNPRVATRREIMLFRDMAAEFAEEAPAFLLARVD
jgi:hypothetical protein